MSPDCFTGTILISLPDESKDDVGDHAHDWGDDQHHQELDHGCVPSQNSVNVTLRFSSGPVETAGTLDTTRRNERMVSPRRALFCQRQSAARWCVGARWGLSRAPLAKEKTGSAIMRTQCGHDATAAADATSPL